MVTLRWPLISRALANHDPSTVYTLLSEGLPKGVAGRALMALIHTVPDWPKPITKIPNLRLSPRELETLNAANDGLSELDTAKQMFVSFSTIKGHRKNIFEKLDVHTMADATRRGRELGLIG